MFLAETQRLPPPGKHPGTLGRHVVVTLTTRGVINAEGAKDIENSYPAVRVQTTYPHCLVESDNIYP